MPLISFSDVDAVNNRKKNPVAGWGVRADSNRVEPLALPKFAVPFKLKPGEKIFTVGSCFARNVEIELNRRGFVLPMWDLFRRPDFSKLEVGVINNYGTPSIYNEIAWALREREFVAEDHILEIRPGRYADIHLIPSLKPEPWETVLARRNAIREAYRAVVDCSVVIMTLGLIELWFDTKTGYYLNVAPRPSMIDTYPGRFQLHVLSYQESFDYLEKAILILKKHAPQLNVVLTVSPVPMMSTHRPVDVMVANTYSKSVLRTVAETIVAKHDFVAYFPSYESVVLSDRALAWEDDMVHVTRDLVAVNVGRMIEAYIEDGGRDEAIADPLSAVEKAKAARASGRDFADAFFLRHGEWSEKSAEFAMEHARHLLAQGRYEEADKAMLRLDPRHVNVAILKARAMTALARGQEAVALLEPFCATHKKSVALWNTLVSAAMASGDADKVNSALWRFRSEITGHTTTAYIRVSRWFFERGDRERALQLAKAVMEEPMLNRTILDLTELLVELGDLALAREALSLLASPVAAEIGQRDRLAAFLGG